MERGLSKKFQKYFSWHVVESTARNLNIFLINTFIQSGEPWKSGLRMRTTAVVNLSEKEKHLLRYDVCSHWRKQRQKKTVQVPQNGIFFFFRPLFHNLQHAS
jgi:hypothetical protein